MANVIRKMVLFIQHYRRILAVVLCLAATIYPIKGQCISFTIGESYSLTSYQAYCHSDKFEAKYNAAGCWSCGIVEALMTSCTNAVAIISDSVVDLAKLILLIGAAVWLSIYFLKSVSSMATQDTSRVLDGAFGFLFKIGVVYTFLNLGIGELVSKVVTPLLSIGIDIGKTFGHL